MLNKLLIAIFLLILSLIFIPIANYLGLAVLDWIGSGMVNGFIDLCRKDSNLLFIIPVVIAFLHTYYLIFAYEKLTKTKIQLHPKITFVETYFLALVFNVPVTLLVAFLTCG